MRIKECDKAKVKGGRKTRERTIEVQLIYNAKFQVYSKVIQLDLLIYLYSFLDSFLL